MVNIFNIFNILQLFSFIFLSKLFRVLIFEIIFIRQLSAWDLSGWQVNTVCGSPLASDVEYGPEACNPSIFLQEKRLDLYKFIQTDFKHSNILAWMDFECFVRGGEFRIERRESWWLASWGLSVQSQFGFETRMCDFVERENVKNQVKYE